MHKLKISVLSLAVLLSACSSPGDQYSKEAGLRIDKNGIAYATGSMQSLATGGVAFRMESSVIMTHESSMDSIHIIPTKDSTMAIISRGYAWICIYQKATSQYLCPAKSELRYDSNSDSLSFNFGTPQKGAVFTLSHSPMAITEGVNGEVEIPSNAISMSAQSTDTDEADAIRINRVTYIQRNEFESYNVMDVDGEKVDFSKAHDTSSIVNNDSSNGGSVNSENSDKVKEDVKRQVITKIATDHNMNPGDVIQYDAQVSSTKGSAGVYNVTGSFMVESDRPSSIYDAVGQQLKSNQCAVDPNSCSSRKIKHTVYFDAVTTIQEKLDGSKGLNITYNSTVDKTLADKAREDAIRQQEAQQQQERQAQEQAQLQQQQQQAQEQQQRDQVKEAQLQGIKTQQVQALEQLKQQHQQQMVALRKKIELRNQEQFASDSASQKQLQTEARQLEQQQSQRRQEVRYAPPAAQQLLQTQMEQASSQLTNQMIKQRDQQAANQRAARQDEQQQLQQLQQEQNQERIQLLQQQAKQLQDAKNSSEPISSTVVIQQQSAPPPTFPVSDKAATTNAPDTNNGIAGQPSNKPSFDCAKASTPTEIAICSDGSLSGLDAQVATEYHSMMSGAVGEQAQSLLVSQRAWVKDRSSCGSDVACLRQSMETRLAALPHISQ